METNQTSVETSKTPRYSRAIAWLGGASFGRAASREGTLSPRQTYGTLPLVLLDAALVATFALRNVLGAGVCIAAAIAIAVLCGVWLKRFNDTTVPYFRWVAYTIIAIQLLLFLPLYIQMWLHPSGVPIVKSIL